MDTSTSGTTECAFHDINLNHLSDPPAFDQKGAIPLRTVYAHHSKIYGLDWSPLSSDELVTCSLDSSIKRFSVLHPTIDPETSLTHPISTIQTSQPVWRARYLPFGHGVLSLAQRGDSTLEMYTFDQENGPVAEFERTALVKEFVWRTRGGEDPNFGAVTDVLF